MSLDLLQTAAPEVEALAVARLQRVDRTVVLPGDLPLADGESMLDIGFPHPSRLRRRRHAGSEEVDATPVRSITAIESPWFVNPSSANSATTSEATLVRKRSSSVESSTFATVGCSGSGAGSPGEVAPKKTAATMAIACRRPCS